MSVDTRTAETAETAETARAAATRGTAPGGPGAPAADGRLPLRTHLRHIGALVRRNALQIKRNPESMADALLTPIVFTLLFVYVFGGAISDEVTGGSYVNYVVPGLMSMMGLSIAMAVGTGVNDDVTKGVMDRFRSMPIARSSVLIAKVVVELGRMTLSMFILLGMGFLLGMDTPESVLRLLAAMGLSLLFGASLIWVFILLGLALPTPQAVQGLAMLIVLPLQFGSSIFTPTSTMPGWLETFTDYNPLSNLADAARALLHGGELAGPVAWTLGWALVITLTTAPLAVARFCRKT
ncbi:ABC transporter permease [Streptomyces yaizuensis]|uniref:Transport permease protein n=1 Tax=Streptomyces yaizuensis TaxID=2989713 RepID=A0ABQ5NUG4_9ACTN|nr:ABC transporter permease [Streptomyces sp. YSPA8]GLF93990.1 ABC transporter permease [Streptomyces sp. YSPA8]